MKDYKSFKNTKDMKTGKKNWENLWFGSKGNHRTKSLFFWLMSTVNVPVLPKAGGLQGPDLRLIKGMVSLVPSRQCLGDL